MGQARSPSPVASCSYTGDRRVQTAIRTQPKRQATPKQMRQRDINNRRGYDNMQKESVSLPKWKTVTSGGQVDEVKPPTLQQGPADDSSDQAEDVNIVPAPQQDPVEVGYVLPVSP